MNFKFLPYLILVLVSFTTCKKTKLKGEFTSLIGTWHWSRGWGDDGSTHLKLELKEWGHYKLYRDKDKIEHGRVFKKDGYLKFIAEMIFNNKNLTLDTKQIVYISNDTINITKTDCHDCAFTTFRKD